MYIHGKPELQRIVRQFGKKSIGQSKLPQMYLIGDIQANSPIFGKSI